MTMTQANLKLGKLVLMGLIVLGLAQADPQPIQDFCIADLSSPSSFYYFNGPPCMNPAHAKASHFATSDLSRPGNTTTKGFSVTLTTNQNLPGHRTQGLSMARIDIAPNELVRPHYHPRASEVTTCLMGEILVGFMDTSNKLYTQQLKVGESFVFPKGLVHFLYNMDPNGPALAVSGLSSENPGVRFASVTKSTSKLTMLDEILEKVFDVDDHNVA